MVRWMMVGRHSSGPNCARIDEYDGNILARHACLAACVYLCVCVCARVCALVRVHSHVVVCSRSRNCKRACVCACMCVYIHRLMNTGLRIRDACPLQSWRIFPFHDDLHIVCRNCCGVGLVSFFLCAHHPRFVRLCFYARKGTFFQSTLILRGYVAMCRRWSYYCCWLEHRLWCGLHLR